MNFAKISALTTLASMGLHLRNSVAVASPHPISPTVTISTAKTEFASNESVFVDVSLKNEAVSESATILDWVVPCDIGDDDDSRPTDMYLFRVATAEDGTVVPYRGAALKRGRPDESRDFRVLEPGEEIACTIDLAKYYDFAEDTDYDIRYQTARVELFEDPVEGEEYHPVSELSSNALRVSIEGREFVSLSGGGGGGGHRGEKGSGRLREPGATGENIFRNCFESEKAEIVEARSLATDASVEAVRFLADVGRRESSGGCPRYENWFGRYEEANHVEVETGFEAILDGLERGDIVFHCDCFEDIFAYVYADEPYEIYMCNSFFEADLTGTDSKLGTVVHEMSHFTVASGTDDTAYGHADTARLAIEDPGLAVNTADNHEYFAENTPGLACGEGGGSSEPPSGEDSGPPNGKTDSGGLVPNGEGCLLSSQCDSGRCDLSGIRRICQARLERGVACNEDDDCKSLSCVDKSFFLGVGHCE